MAERSVRSDDARAVHTREVLERIASGSIFRGRLDFDKKLVPAGMHAVWFSEHTLGQDGLDNIQRAMDDRGFFPATTADMPALTRRDYGGKFAPKDDLVRRGDCLLMLQPIEIHHAEMAARERMNKLREGKSVAPIGNTPGAQVDGTNFQELPGSTHEVRVSKGVTPGKFAE